MNLRKYQPLFVIYFRDPVEGVSIYTLPLNSKTNFLKKLATDVYIEIEGIVLKTSYIVKCEPLEKIDPVQYKILTSPHHIRHLLLKREKQVPFNSVGHLENYIQFLKKENQFDRSKH